MSLSPFLSKIKSGQILISDGATGTNLQTRGLPIGITAENWVLENPAEIERLQRKFVEAGSDIILTCTFGATPLRLEHTGMAGKTVEVNRAAVAIARKATAGTNTLVAGSIGPTGLMMEPMGELTPDAARRSFTEQARILADAGVDFFVVETQFDLAEAEAAVLGIREVSNLPLVVSFSYDRGKRTMMGVKPAQAGELLLRLGVDVAGINCGRSLDDNLAAMQELCATVNLPIWFKPNAGLPQVAADGSLSYTISPEMMGTDAKRWIDEGAVVVGGCCGNSPAHIRQIAQTAKAYQPGI